LLVAAGCKVIVSDDGLQHLALRRDLEIIVIDGLRGLGNGALLPQGPLRESPQRLHCASAVVINGQDLAGVGALVAEPLSMGMEVGELRTVSDGLAQPLAMLQQSPVHAVAATGHPARFFALLRELGARPVEHAFPDHHPFTARDLSFPDALPIVMTEKDAVKCRAFATDRMQYLEVSVHLTDADAARLLQLALDCIANGEPDHA
jgi:tetraacyldisaccharide 4'-kinase